MRVTLLGHASVLVEMQGARCIMDPVFQDPFEEGAVVSCPKRVIHPEKLGAIDLIVISHSHLDHFDIPTLARLPRAAHVVFPKDHAIAYVLEQLGYKNLHPMDAMAVIPFQGTTLLTTRSHVTNVVEFGVIFKDASGTFWNQVDTVLMPETIDMTRKQVGAIDLHFSMYASQNFDFFEGRSAGFPHAMHAMNLSNAAAIGAKMVVPGSAGFRFGGPFEWCNAFLFPVSREAFLDDLARVAPQLKTSIANPGDVFEVERGAVTRHPAASPLASMVEDDTALLRYDPSAPVPPLSDPNPDGYPPEKIESAVSGCFERLTAFVHAAYATPDPVVAEYRQHQTSYAVGVVFPNGDERYLRIEFGEALPVIEEGDAAVRPADTVYRIAASALTAWVLREKSYFYFRGFSRKYSTFHVTARREGKLVVEPKSLPDLLTHYLIRKAPGAEMALKERLDFQLKPYLRAAAKR